MVDSFFLCVLIRKFIYYLVLDILYPLPSRAATSGQGGHIMVCLYIHIYYLYYLVIGHFVVVVVVVSLLIQI